MNRSQFLKTLITGAASLPVVGKVLAEHALTRGAFDVALRRGPSPLSRNHASIVAHKYMKAWQRELNCCMSAMAERSAQLKDFQGGQWPKTAKIVRPYQWKPEDKTVK